MEPWQEAEQYFAEREARAGKRCVCCGEAITGEYCLELESFGLNGFACCRCVQLAMALTR